MSKESFIASLITIFASAICFVIAFCMIFDLRNQVEALKLEHFSGGCHDMALPMNVKILEMHNLSNKKWRHDHNVRGFIEDYKQQEAEYLYNREKDRLLSGDHGRTKNKRFKRGRR